MWFGGSSRICGRGSGPYTDDHWVLECGDKASGTAAGPGLGAFVHAEQQLQAQGDARVPPQGKDADVAGHDGRPQEVLHG